MKRSGVTGTALTLALALTANAAVAAPTSPVRPTPTPARIDIAPRDLEVLRIGWRDDRWYANVRGDGGPTVRLRSGDKLQYGVVHSLDRRNVWVEIPFDERARATTRGVFLRYGTPRAPAPVTIERETTHIDAPLLPGGTPDYGAWLNAADGRGVTPESNAAIPLLAAFGSNVDDVATGRGAPRLDVSSTAFFPDGALNATRPWTDTEAPALAALLARHEILLRDVAAATRRPSFFIPVPANRRLHELFPIVAAWDQAGHMLLSRGFLHLGRGDIDRAIEDMLTGQRLAAHRSHGHGTVEFLFSMAMWGHSSRLLPPIAARLRTPEEAEHLLAALDALPRMHELADIFDRGERCFSLDTLLARREDVARRGPGTLLSHPRFAGHERQYPSGNPAYLLQGALPDEALDWDAVLRRTNRWWDRLVSLARARSDEDRRKAYAELAAEKAETARTVAALRAAAGRYRNLRVAAGAMARTPEGRRRLSVVVGGEASDEARTLESAQLAEARFQVGKVSVALALHRLRTGTYPDTLDGLQPRFDATGFRLKYELERAATPAGRRYVLRAAPDALNPSAFLACADSDGTTDSARSCSILEK